MKILLRNLQPSTPLNFDFTGTGVTPLLVTVQPLKSQVVETSLSVLEFRKITEIATALGAGNLTMSARGGAKVLN
jgi:hypothetical protein